MKTELFPQIPPLFYKKVFLKSPADLPKEDGAYIVYTSVGYEKVFIMLKEQIASSNKGYIEWYLQPLPEQMVTDKEIKTLIEKITVHFIEEGYGILTPDMKITMRKMFSEWMRDRLQQPEQTDPFSPTDKFPEIDFRTDIANELSRDELIERLCEMNEKYQTMRKEWFEAVHLNKVQQPDRELREELIKFSKQFYSDEETVIRNVDEYLNQHQ